MKQCYAGGVFCVMAANAHPTDEGTSLSKRAFAERGVAVNFDALYYFLLFACANQILDNNYNKYIFQTEFHILSYNKSTDIII